MNIKRSFFTLLMGSAGLGLFLANCTVSTSSSDKCTKGDKDTGCECPGKITGYQVCNSSGVFGDCQCPGTNTAGSNSGGGTTSNDAGAGNTSEGGTTSKGGTTGNGGTTANGGTTTTAGTDAGGVSAAEGGAGGEGGVTAEMCNDCLMRLCDTEWQACFNDPDCISENIDGTGQYERISRCINDERLNGLVKRDVVRNCGVTIGASATDATLADAWAPQGMAATTTNLLNCLATSPSEAPNADWANSDANFPIVNDMVEPAPWPSDSCAKLACTGKL